MTQTQNISIRNALVRITMGLSMVAYGTSHLIKNPASNRGRMMIVLGAMKAGEGTLRYCPTKAVLNTSIQNIMSENSLGKTGNSPMQNMGSAMQNVGSTVGSTVQNMMGGSGSGTGGGSGSGTGTGGGSGNGLQNVVPEVTKLMKDFAGIGNTSGNSTTNNQASSTNNNQTGNTGSNTQSTTTGNATNPSNIFGSTSSSSNGNKNGNTGVFGSANGNANGISSVLGSANGNANGNSGVFGSTPQKADNNAYGDPYKNTNGKTKTIGESSNKNGSSPINPS